MELERDPDEINHSQRYIKRNYCDHSEDAPDPQNLDECLRTDKRFPMKLHKLLVWVETAGLAHIVSWQVHGRAFKIHDTEKFLEKVTPLYFSHCSIRSFYRQLNLYGFLKITQGTDKGAYYHELFLRGKHFLAKKMKRQKVKGTLGKSAADPANEPNFYKMPFVKLTLGHAEASASFQLHEESLFAEEAVSAADAVTCLQKTKDEDFLLEEISWDSFPITNEPFDSTIVSDDFFCIDEVFQPMLQEHEPPFPSVNHQKDHFFNEKEASTTNEVSCLQVIKGDNFLLDNANNIMLSNDLFRNDEVLSPLLQRHKPPFYPVQTRTATIYDESIFEDISLERDLSESKQYYSMSEYVDMCAMLQMMIDKLE